MARFARHASENGLALARCARHASEKPRKSPLEDTPREYLARKGPFSLHGPLESCTARESCHELAIFPSEATFGMHGAQNLPRIDAQERTAREYCHRRMPKSASRVHFAIVERPGTHQGIILPWPAARKCTAATSCHGSLLQECFSTTYCQEGPRLPGLAAKSQWCHEVGRPRPNVTSANSTTRANTSKKP